MNIQTFVWNSSGSHGTVGESWSAEYGLEIQYSPTFFKFIETILNFLVLLLSYFYKNGYSTPISGQFFIVQMLTIVAILFFSIFHFFQGTQGIFYFFL